MTINETRFYGENGSLFPYDLRHIQADPSFCDFRPDGSLKLRLHTEPGFGEVFLIFNDGQSHAEPMRLWGTSYRFQFWEITIHPAQPRLYYAFALKRTDGTIVYLGGSGVISGIEFFFHLDLSAYPVFSTPRWAQGAFIYQIFPDRFADGDPANNPPGTVPWGTPPEPFQFQGGDLPGIVQRLDYLESLGVNVIYLNPIFTSPSSHKYDAVDFYQVDPAFGGDQGLRTLVQAAHARDIRVIVDASFNHCFPTFFAFKDILKNGENSRYLNWFTIHSLPIQVKVRPHLIPEGSRRSAAFWQAWLGRFQEATGIPVHIVDDDGPVIQPSYLAWFSALNMPKLNLDNPETRQYFLEVARYWVREFAIDGWRMDVVPHVSDSFWVDFRRAVKEVNPEAYLLAEIWGNSSFWLQGNRFDATMDYNFRQLALDYFAYTRMGTHQFVDGCAHLLQMYSSDVTLANQHLLSSHDTARFLHLAGEDRRKLHLATFFQFTFPGAPGVYYGDEIGMTGANDPDCRRAFPWEHEDTWDHELLEMVRALGKARTEHPALRFGDWQPAWVGDEGLAFWREYQGERLLAVMARQEPIRNLEMKAGIEDLILGIGEGGQYEISEGILRLLYLPAWSGAVFTVSNQPT